MNISLQGNNTSEIQSFFNSQPNTTTINPNLNYTYWAGNFSTLQFYGSQGTDYLAVLTTIDPFFSPDTFSNPVICSFPISGQYGFMARLGHYLLLIFALILRHHDWLSFAALGTAMTYAATTSIHAFALFGSYQFGFSAPAQDENRPTDYGDIDIVAMLPILASSFVMLTPLLHWSKLVKEYKFRPVVVFWALLIFSALVPTAVVNFEGIPFYSVRTQLVTCSNTIPGCNDTAAVFVSYDDPEVSYLDSKDFYKKCQCTDNCGSSPVDGAIFRKDTALEAFLRSDDLYKRLGSKFFRGLYISNLIALVLIGAYGIVGLFQIQLSPAEVRRRLFSRFTHATLKSQQHTFQTRFLYHLGKWVAASVYLLTILVAIICPLVFISSIVVNEMVAWGYPASEAADAIGQWGFWVSALWVIIAAIIQKYSTDINTFIELIIHTPKRIIKWMFGKDTFRNETVKEKRNMDNSVVARAQEFVRLMGIPFKYVYGSIRKSLARIRQELVDFIEWWKDPTQQIPISSHLVNEFEDQLPGHYTNSIDSPSSIIIPANASYISLPHLPRDTHHSVAPMLPSSSAHTSICSSNPDMVENPATPTEAYDRLTLPQNFTSVTNPRALLHRSITEPVDASQADGPPLSGQSTARLPKTRMPATSEAGATQTAADDAYEMYVADKGWPMPALAGNVHRNGES